MPAKFGSAPLRMVVEGQVRRVLLLEAAAILDCLLQGIGIEVPKVIVVIKGCPPLSSALSVSANRMASDRRG